MNNPFNLRLNTRQKYILNSKDLITEPFEDQLGPWQLTEQSQNSNFLILLNQKKKNLSQQKQNKFQIKYTKCAKINQQFSIKKQYQVPNLSIDLSNKIMRRNQSSQEIEGKVYYKDLGQQNVRSQSKQLTCSMNYEKKKSNKFINLTQESNHKDQSCQTEECAANIYFQQKKHLYISSKEYDQLQMSPSQIVQRNLKKKNNKIVDALKYIQQQKLF